MIEIKIKIKQDTEKTPEQQIKETLETIGMDNITEINIKQ